MEVEVGDAASRCSHHEEIKRNPGVGDAAHRCRFKRSMLSDIDCQEMALALSHSVRPSSWDKPASTERS